MGPGMSLAPAWKPFEPPQTFQYGSGADEAHKDLVMRFFGPPNGQYTSTAAMRQAITHEILPASYRGSNARLVEIIRSRIEESEEFTLKLFPIVHQWEGGNVVTVYTMEFHNHLLDEVPEEGVVRQVTHSSREYAQTILRYGLGMQMEHGMLMTPMGQGQYAQSINQIATGATRRIMLSTLFAISNPPPVPNNWFSQHGLPYSNSVRAEMARKEIAEFGICIQELGGMEKAINSIRTTIRRQKGSEPDTLVLPYNLATRLRLYGPPQNGYDGREKLKPVIPETNGASYDGLRLYQSPYAEFDRTLPPGDAFESDRQIGEMFTLYGDRYQELPALSQKTSLRNVKGFDCDANRWDVISFREAWKNTGIFHYEDKLSGYGSGPSGGNGRGGRGRDDDGGTERNQLLSQQIGEQLLGSYKTFGQFLKQTGAMEAVTRDISDWIQSAPPLGLVNRVGKFVDAFLVTPEMRAQFKASVKRILEATSSMDVARGVLRAETPEALMAVARAAGGRMGAAAVKEIKGPLLGVIHAMFPETKDIGADVVAASRGGSAGAEAERELGSEPGKRTRTLQANRREEERLLSEMMAAVQALATAAEKAATSEESVIANDPDVKTQVAVIRAIVVEFTGLAAVTATVRDGFIAAIDSVSGSLGVDDDGVPVHDRLVDLLNNTRVATTASRHHINAQAEADRARERRARGEQGQTAQDKHAELIHRIAVSVRLGNGNFVAMHVPEFFESLLGTLASSNFSARHAEEVFRIVKTLVVIGETASLEDSHEPGKVDLVEQILRQLTSKKTVENLRITAGGLTQRADEAQLQTVLDSLNQTAVQENAAERAAYFENEPSTIQGLIGAAFYSTGDGGLRRRQFDFFLDNDRLFPMHIICARPHVTYKMCAMVGLKSGGDTGVILHVEEDFLLYSDGATKRLFGNYTCRQNTIILRPQNLAVLPNASCSGYRGGGSLEFWNPLNQFDVQTYKTSNPLKKSLFAIPLLWFEKDKMNPKDCLYLPGYVHPAYITALDEQTPLQVAACAVLTNHWGWCYSQFSNDRSVMGHVDGAQIEAHRNMVCYQVEQYNTVSYGGETVAPFSERIPTCGHWKWTYTGVMDDRCNGYVDYQKAILDMGGRQLGRA